MPQLRFPVCVFVDRAPLANRWVSEQWRVAAVEPDRDPVTSACTRLADETGVARWRCGGFSLELVRSESEGYHLNLSAMEPKAFVLCRMDEPRDGVDSDMRMRPHLVTVSYNEAARFLDGGEQVESVALHPEIADWMRPFVAANYHPEPRRKARRNELYERDGDTAAATKRER